MRDINEVLGALNPSVPAEAAAKASGRLYKLFEFPDQDIIAAAIRSFYQSASKDSWFPRCLEDAFSDMRKVPQPLDERLADRIVELHDNGWSDVDIANYRNVSIDNVNAAISAGSGEAPALVFDLFKRAASGEPVFWLFTGGMWEVFDALDEAKQASEEHLESVSGRDLLQEDVRIYEAPRMSRRPRDGHLVAVAVEVDRGRGSRDFKIVDVAGRAA